MMMQDHLEQGTGGAARSAGRRAEDASVWRMFGMTGSRFGACWLAQRDGKPPAQGVRGMWGRSLHFCRVPCQMLNPIVIKLYRPKWAPS